MDYNTNKFKLFLERMENRYTLNESSEKLSIISEGIGTGLIKYIKDSRIDLSGIAKSLKKSYGLDELGSGKQFGVNLNDGLDVLSTQVKKLNNGESVPSFNSKNIINANLDNFVDQLVDVDLKKIGLLDDLTDAEISNLKSFLKGQSDVVSDKLTILPIYTEILLPLASFILPLLSRI